MREKNKYDLFCEVLAVEQQLNDATDKKTKMHIAKQLCKRMDSLCALGWRQEYDLWVQGLRE